MLRIVYTVLCGFGLVVSAAGLNAADNKKLGACDVMTEAEASAFAGGAVVASYKDETKPSKQNKFDHITACGFYPKGYDIRTATSQPERGLIVTLHSMRSAKEARALYDETANNRDAGDVTTLSDIGEAALMKEGEARKQKVAQLTFVKKAVTGHVSTWGGEKTNKRAIEIAKKVAERLP